MRRLIIVFAQSQIDHSVFICHLTKKKEQVIVAVATDNMAITGNSDCAVERFKDEIKKIYEITNLGDLHWILGMEIKCDRAACTISINQKAYIEGNQIWAYQCKTCLHTHWSSTSWLTDRGGGPVKLHACYVLYVLY